MTRGYTRREVLSAFLGLPVALAACRSSETPPLPEGEIVGASDAFGHRLRQAPRFEVAAERWQKRRVVIVGAGVAGLAAARRLRQSGVEDFILLELESAPGGTARSGQSPVTAYPWGAHYLPAPRRENAELVALLDEMGILEGRDAEGEPVVAEQFLCRDPDERTFFRGRWYEGLYLRAGATEEDLRQLERFNQEVDRWVAWRDAKGRRAFTLPVAACSDDPRVTELDRISMAEWLDRNGFTSARLRWVIEYGCRDDYGLTLATTSAWAGLFYHASRVRRPGEESAPLITWPEGNGRLVAHLYRPVEGRAQLGLAACEIIPTAAGVDVIAIDREAEQAFGFHAERVVFAAPHFLARYLIRDYRDNPPAHVAAFEYGAWMVANLFLRERPRERFGSFPPAWDNVLYDSPSLGYVTATHQRGLERGPTVFTYYYPLTDEAPREARARLLAAGRDEWADVALADLQRAHPDIRGLVERLDVMRWGHAMILPRPGFVWGEARRAALRPYRNIHFAHSDLSGVALFEEAFYHGTRAADEIKAG